MDAVFIHPFALQVVGPSQFGKTFFVKNFFKHIEKLCDIKFDRVLFYYGEWQKAYETDFLVNGIKIEFFQGLPNPSDYDRDQNKKKLICIDDLYKEASNTVVLDLFTKGSHHKNISIIFITQNLFHKGSFTRDISLNTNYIVIFKNPRDRAQFQFLARQVYPEDPKFLQEAYLDATAIPHGYLLLDLKQTTLDELRFRTKIFPDDTPHYIYLPKFKFR